MPRILLLGLACLGVSVGSAAAGETDSSASNEASVSIEALDFMAGCWQGPLGEAGFIRETFTEPSGGLMLGNSQVVMGGETQFFELIRLVEGADGVSYNPMPAGKPSVAFPLTERSATHAVFSNPQHDFPKIIVYRVEGNTLTATIEGDGRDGAVRKEEFRMEAIPCGGEAHRQALGAVTG